jgi:hypothetical protein
MLLSLYNPGVFCQDGSMAKAKKSSQLKRWIALDRELGGNGLDVRAFAKQHGVTRQTVYRDLLSFAELGRVTDYQPTTFQVEDIQSVPWVHRYETGVKWLFVDNMRS